MSVPPEPHLLRSFSDIPIWDGSNPAGRTMLVSCDASLGECILLARYIPLLSGRGARVIVACPVPLIRVLAQMPGVEVVPAGDRLPPVDVCVAINALPRLFGTTTATIPTFGAYLRAPISLVEAWRQRIRPMRDAGQRVVGLAMKACSDNRQDAMLRASDAQFIALDDLDLADAAAAISMLDLVIATESPVAHLAGALGKPARVLVRHSPEWCWRAGSGSDTPWYPSARLFHQTQPDNWDAPLHELADFLSLRIARPAAAAIRSAAAA